MSNDITASTLTCILVRLTGNSSRANTGILVTAECTALVPDAMTLGMTHDKTLLLRVQLLSKSAIGSFKGVAFQYFKELHSNICIQICQQTKPHCSCAALAKHVTDPDLMGGQLWQMLMSNGPVHAAKEVQCEQQRTPATKRYWTQLQMSKARWMLLSKASYAWQHEKDCWLQLADQTSL